jgi:hypothetical protein
MEEAFEEDQCPHRAVEPVIIIINIFILQIHVQYQVQINIISSQYLLQNFWTTKWHP